MKHCFYRAKQNTRKTPLCTEARKQHGSFKTQNLNAYIKVAQGSFVACGLISRAQAGFKSASFEPKRTTHVTGSSSKNKSKQPRKHYGSKKQTLPSQTSVQKKGGYASRGNEDADKESVQTNVDVKDSVLWTPFKGLVNPPDPIYQHGLVSMLVQRVMKHGKKQKAYKLTYAALERLQQKTQQDPVEVLVSAVENVRPTLEVKPRRVGGSTYQVPYEVKPERGTVLALRWILNAVRQRRGINTIEKLQVELYNASKGSGSAIKRRDDEHRSAESNRAFIRYRVGADQRKRPGAKPGFKTGALPKAKKA